MRTKGRTIIEKFEHCGGQAGFAQARCVPRVGYTEMDPGGAWKAKLLKELAAAGYKVDWANAL